MPAGIEPLEERRSGVAEFNVRSKILTAINDTSDQNQRNLLLLLFGVLEVNEKGMHRIEKKLDNIMADEKRLKEAVLNGHEPAHHKHHDWIENRIANDKFYTDFITRTTSALEWLDLYRQKVNATEPICEWAKRKMVEEDELRKTKKSLVQKFFEGMSGNAGSLLIAAAVGWLIAAAKFWP